MESMIRDILTKFFASGYEPCVHDEESADRLVAYLEAQDLRIMDKSTGWPREET